VSNDLVHDLAAKLKVLQNHKTVLEPYNSISILLEALSLSQLQSSAEMTHSHACSLGGNAILFDGWNESYVVQSAMWNNSETWFFRITIRKVRLDREMVTSMFVT
jgi:hypothetical protein